MVCVLKEATVTTKLPGWILMAALASYVLPVCADSDPQLREAATHIAFGTCAGCHGPHGISFVPRFPNLAGQSAGYLAAQLKAFRDHTREEPDAAAFMWGISASLNEHQISAVAEYYASQEPAAGRELDGSLEREGKRIYERGLPAQKVAPCSACHGARGEGIADFPRLAGQRAPYVRAQLRAFQQKLRSADAMNAVAGGLTEEDVRALAAYVQSL
jgi:cytochrome c553